MKIDLRLIINIVGSYKYEAKPDKYIKYEKAGKRNYRYC